VVTSTPLEHEWAQTAVVEGGLADLVTEVKHQPGGDIGVDISVTQSLLEASLVDERRCVIAPACNCTGESSSIQRALAGCH
jgi:hypothetical protein